MSDVEISYLYTQLIGGLIPDAVLSDVRTLGLSDSDAIVAYLKTTPNYTGSITIGSNVIRINNINAKTYGGVGLGSGPLQVISGPRFGEEVYRVTYQELPTFTAQAFVTNVANVTSESQELNFQNVTLTTSGSNNNLAIESSIMALRPFTRAFYQVLTIRNLTADPQSVQVQHQIQQFNSEMVVSNTFESYVISSNTMCGHAHNATSAVTTAYIFPLTAQNNFTYNRMPTALVTTMSFTVAPTETLVLPFLSMYSVPTAAQAIIQDVDNALLSYWVQLPDIVANHNAWWQERLRSGMWLLEKASVVPDSPDDVAFIQLQRQIQISTFNLLNNYPTFRPYANTADVINFKTNEALYVLPFLNYFYPTLAQSVVQQHYVDLPAAQEEARTKGYSGASYGNFVLSGLVAISVWNHYRATRDMEWLMEYGIPVLKGVADLFVGLCQVNLPISITLNINASSDLILVLAYTAIWYAIEAFSEVGIPPRAAWLTVYNATYVTVGGDTKNLLLKSVTALPLEAYFPLQLENIPINTINMSALITANADALNALPFTAAALYALEAQNSISSNAQRQAIGSNLAIIQGELDKGLPPFRLLNSSQNGAFLLNIAQPYGRLICKGGVNINRYAYMEFDVQCRAAYFGGSVMPPFIQSLKLLNVGQNQNGYSVVNPLTYLG